MDSCGTSMPLLMHLINSVKNNGSNKAPINNNFVEPTEVEKKEDIPSTDDLLWENKNVDIKQQLDENLNKNSPNVKSPSEGGSQLSSLNDLPSLSQKKTNLVPLDFNPKESPKEERFGESVDQEKKNLDEVDKKLKEFENDGLKMEMDRSSPDKDAMNFEEKDPKPKISDGLEDYNDDFEDDIEEDLPVEDFDPQESKDKNLEFGESGVSASQSMGMDPSVQSLDIEEYDHIEQAIINSPFK